MGACVYEDPRGARHWVHLRVTDLYAVGSVNPDHDAVMRIGGEAPGGGPILSATIMVLRAPMRLSAVRAQYHNASALSF